MEHLDCEKCKQNVLYENIETDENDLDIGYELIIHTDLCENHQFVDDDDIKILTVDDEIYEPIELAVALESKIESLSNDMFMLFVLYYQFETVDAKEKIMIELGRLYIKIMELNAELKKDAINKENRAK